MTTSITISTAKQFFDLIAEPDANALNGAKTLRNAFHACISLFSLRDWVANDHAGKTWTHNGSPLGTISGVESIQKGLVNVAPSFLVIANVANSAKHMTLKQQWPWKRMEGSANVVHQSVSTGGIGSPIGAPIGGTLTSDIIVADLGSKLHDVPSCVEDVRKLWRSLITENGW